MLEAGPALHQLQHARHSVGPVIVQSEYSSHLSCGVPRWYEASPPSPDAGPALNQRLCRRQH